MRKLFHQQPTLINCPVAHEHGRELEVISDLLDGMPEVLISVQQDLVGRCKSPATGREGLNAEQVLRALIVKQMNGFSFEMLAFHLQDSLCYRRFCKVGMMDEGPSKSALQRAIKLLKPETLELCNHAILARARSEKVEEGLKVRIDCTVMETDIHHPTDSTLLEDGVRVLCRTMRKAKQHFGIRAVDRRRRAKRRSLQIKNATKDKDRQGWYRDLLGITREVLEEAERVAGELATVRAVTVEAMALSIGLAQTIEHYIPLLAKVIEQTKHRVFEGEKVAAKDKIVSLFEPHTDIIVKKRRETCYGHKVVLAGGASGLVTDLIVLDGNPADSTLALTMLERHQQFYGRPPRQAAFDGGFASKQNLAEAKALKINDVAFSKKRGLTVEAMVKSTWVYKRLANFRAGIEGMISFLKRCIGFDRCNFQGKQSFASYAWASVLTANLLLLARRLLL